MAWNQPKDKKTQNNRSNKWGMFCLLCLVICAIFSFGIWILLPYSSKNLQPKASNPNNSRQIKTVKAQIAHNANIKKQIAENSDIATNRIVSQDLGGYPKLNMDTYVSTDPGFSNRWERFKEEQSRLPFKHISECEIAVILKTKPGKMVLDTAMHPMFIKDFLESLDEPIHIDENDTEETRQLKEDMVEAKKTLKEAYDRGEDILALLKKERQELNKIYLLKENLRQEMLNLQNEASTQQEIDDFVDAANTMLDKHGADYIRLPFRKRDLHLSIQKDK